MKDDNKTVNAYVPIGIELDLEEMLVGTGLCPDRLKLLFHQLFLSRIQLANNKNSQSYLYGEGWVAIDSRILKKLLTKNYCKYLDWAEEHSLIERRRDNMTGGIKFTAGAYSQQMRIPNKLLHKHGSLKHFTKTPITKHKALKAVQSVKDEYKQRRESGKWYHLVTDTHHAIINMNNLVRFRMTDAENYLRGEIKLAGTPDRKARLHNYIHILEAINDGHLDYFTVDTFGNRLHTPITSLYSKLRDFMYFHGHENEQLVHIDIRNSQVYLLSCILAHPEVIETILPEFSLVMDLLVSNSKQDDVCAFYKKCCDGDIYEYMSDKFKPLDSHSGQGCEIIAPLRERVKTMLIAFLYSKVKSMVKSDEYNVFTNLYPNIVKGITGIKSMGEKQFPFMREFYTSRQTKKYVGDSAAHKNLSRMMQLMESRIMLGLVSSSLIQMQLMPFITIHDAFILPAKHLSLIQSVIQEQFISLGLVPPKLKVTSLGRANHKL